MADAYVDAVLKGRIPECQFIVMACQRYRDMRAAAEKPKSEFWWSPDHVFEVCKFIETCPQVQGGDDGATMLLEPCQIWIVANIFGFRTDVGSKNVRWFVEVFIDGPRKFGKTALTAPIDIYCFLYEQEKGSQVLLGASSRPQAMKAYRPIKQILDEEPELVEKFGLKVTGKEIRRPDGGFITTVSAIGRKEDGAIPHVIHIDEVHAVTAALHDVFASAMGSRDNELFLQTTTAGFNTSGPAYAQRKRLERVLMGQEQAPRFFGVIYTIDDDDMKNPLRWENVVKAHPMLGVTIKEATIRTDMEAARFNATKRAEFLAKRLNVYERGASRAVSIDEWRSCGSPKLGLDDFLGQKCYIGVDLSSHDDQTALGLLFEFDDLIAVFADHFLPANSPSFSNEKIADQLHEWVSEGWIETTDLPIVDYAKVQVRIEEYCDLFDVEAIVFDRAHSIQMAGSLIDKGHPAGIIQATSVEMSEPTKDLVVRARNKLIVHNGNPVLAWNASNVCLTPGDLWRPIKDRTAPHLKIDGFSALVHANVARMGRLRQREKRSDPPFDPNRVVRSLSPWPTS